MVSHGLRVRRNGFFRWKARTSWWTAKRSVRRFCGDRLFIRPSSTSKNGSLKTKGQGRCCQSLRHTFSRCKKAPDISCRFSEVMHPKRHAVLCQGKLTLHSLTLRFKGIFPREPRHRKKANKGSSAPTSFYYAKDIAYLAHEPVLRKLREHKAFAKKLSRAIGRGEWSTAKSLDEHKPTYRLDHIIKERQADVSFLRSFSSLT